jgi:peroxiredoxin
MTSRRVSSSLGIIALLGLLAGSAIAQEKITKSSAAETVRQLEHEAAQLREQMLTRYERATPEERKSLPDFNLWPCEQLMPKLAEAAEQFAGTPDAATFHLWIVRNSFRLTKPTFLQGSVDRLLADHIEDERLEELAQWLPHFLHVLGVEGTLSRLDKLQQAAPKLDVKAACMLARTSVAPGTDEQRKARLRELLAFAPATASGRSAEGRLFELQHLQVGCVAPEILGTTLAGTPFRLSDYRGKVVVLEFWNVHCRPCREKAPTTAARVKQYANEPFAHIGIHTGENPESVVRATCEELGVTWPVVLDAAKAGARNGPIATRWQVSGWPTIYVIDHHGIIRCNWAREREMTELVPALLEVAKQQ